MVTQRNRLKGLELSLSPSQKVMRARMGAFAQQRAHNTQDTTAAAREAGPASIGWHERQVDPDGVLEPAERRRRAEAHKKEHFARLAFKSARSRSKTKSEQTRGTAPLQRDRSPETHLGWTAEGVGDQG
jgi:hypothetical protein